MNSHGDMARADNSDAPRERPLAPSLEMTIDTPKLARNVLIFCIAAELLFVALDYHITYGGLVDYGPIRRLFNITREDGMPSWFGVTQTFLVGLTLWFIYIAVKRRGGPRWKSTGWLVLAAFFTYMAVDDGSALHERLGSMYKDMKGGDEAILAVFPSYTWQYIMLPFFATLGLFTLVFLWSQLRSASSRCLLAAALGCLVLAVTMDFVEGLDRNHRWNVYTWLSAGFDQETWMMERYPNKLEAWSQTRFGKSAYDTLRHFSKSIEETLEMLANSIFWYLFLRHLSVAVGDLRVRFGPRLSAKVSN